MMGRRINVESVDVGQLIAKTGQSGGIARKTRRIAGDVDHAACLGVGDLPADLGAGAGTRRIKHHHIGSGQIVAHIDQGLRHITGTDIHIIQMDMSQIALRIAYGRFTTFHAQHARAFRSKRSQW